MMKNAPSTTFGEKKRTFFFDMGLPLHVIQTAHTIHSGFDVYRYVDRWRYTRAASEAKDRNDLILKRIRELERMGAGAN